MSRNAADSNNQPVAELEAEDPEIRRSVQVAQMKMLFESALPGSIMATLFAFALAWHMQPLVAESVLAWWLTMKCLTVLPRMAHALSFERRRTDTLDWLVSGNTLLLLDGIAWGSAGIVLMPPDDISGMTVVAATLSGIAAIAAFAIHAEWRACAAFTSALLIPSIGYFLARGDEFGLYGAASIGTFLALLLAAARRSERHVVELLTLRFANAKLTTQLSDALSKAEADGRTKDIFVANMSHELRTPLHGMLGLARTLSRSVSPDDRANVSLIRRSGEHLLGLINNILEYSRFRGHGIDIHPQEADIVRVVEDVVSICKPSAAERQLQLTSQLNLPDSLVANVDAFRLRQILLNLIGNAIKFTEPQGLIFVRASELPESDRLRIEVADTGIGISASAMKTLFEPFSQADVSPTRRHGGTGLGLNITRAICHAMDGEIFCESVVGRGSVFSVELPLQRAMANAAPVAKPTRQDSAFVQERFGGGRVLLAEDNPVNALVAEFALKRFGLEVDHVDSGFGVVDRLCSLGDRPDMVLLDCQMPGMDGFEAARKVRAYEEEHGLFRVPIVALTANVFPADRDLCRQAGMDAFLGKPFGDEELHAVLAAFSVVPKGAGDRMDAASSGYAALL